MNRPEKAAVTSFLVSRGLLCAIAILLSQLSFLGKAGDVWETRAELRFGRLAPELRRVAMSGDAWWYRSIALSGYGPRVDAGGTPNYAFFPLYPLAVRYLGPLRDFALDGMILSNAAFAIALLLFAKLCAARGVDPDDTTRAVVLLAFFPTSYFCSAPLPESMFLLFTVASLLAAENRRWPLAGLMGCLASLTRLQGILLIAPLILVFRRALPTRIRDAAWLLLVPAGTAGFSSYLWWLTGKPFAFIAVQAHWHRAPTGFWTAAAKYVSNPALVAEPWNLISFNLACAVLLVAAAAGLRRQHSDWALYALLSCLLPLSTGSVQSLARYSVVVFPVYLWLARARQPILQHLITALCAALWGWLVALFLLRVDFALA